jgi:hypothetical protein
MEFLAYSIDDIQVKFLTAIGQYNLMFSNYYIVQKDALAKREAGRMNIMNKMSNKKFVKMEQSDSNSSEEDK